MRDLPRPGLEPMSPALAGGFLTTAPPGKSPPLLFIDTLKHICVCVYRYASKKTKTKLKAQVYFSVIIYAYGFYNRSLYSLIFASSVP